MALVTIKDLSIRFRGPLLLDGVSCQIDAGQRIGLLGRNGAGKTTFMRILRGDVEPDNGEALIAPLTKISLLPQDVPHNTVGRVVDVVEHGWQVATAGDHDEHETEWRKHQSVAQILSRMQLDGTAEFAALSAGMKRASCWPKPSSRHLICCSSMNRPTIWTSKPLPGWRIFSSVGPGH